MALRFEDRGPDALVSRHAGERQRARTLCQHLSTGGRHRIHSLKIVFILIFKKYFLIFNTNVCCINFLFGSI